MQLVLSIFVNILLCTAFLWPMTPNPNSTVLFSTRSEDDQRDGFVSIPLPSGLYTIEANGNLDEEAEEQEASRRYENMTSHI